MISSCWNILSNHWICHAIERVLHEISSNLTSYQSEWPLVDLTVNQLNKYLTAVDRMAQEFQNMKTTHSWINLITRASVQVLHFSFRGLHERFEASTDDLRSPQYDGGEHDMFNIKDIWQTQAILFLKSLSERVGSDIERLWIWTSPSSIEFESI